MRAERVGLISVGMESGQIVLRYPALSEATEAKAVSGPQISRLPDLGPGIRVGKYAYWCMFGKDPDWQDRLLEALDRLDKSK